MRTTYCPVANLSVRAVDPAGDHSTARVIAYRDLRDDARIWRVGDRAAAAERAVVARGAPSMRAEMLADMLAAAADGVAEACFAPAAEHAGRIVETDADGALL